MLHQLTITPAERESSQLAPQTLTTAVSLLQTEGYVVLHNVADSAHMDAICGQMYRDIAQYNSTAEEPVKGGNFVPSRKMEFLFDDVLMNPFVAAVLGGFMGPEVSCGMYSSNITMPGLGGQALHVDMKPHEAGADLSGPCPAAVANFPLVDFTIENGATELWPGTHRLLREPGEFEVSPRLQDARRATVPPLRAEMPRGSVLLRDIRLWHGGKINNCDYIRPMLALIMNGGYKPGQDEMSKIASIGPMPEGSRNFFMANPAIHYNVDYVTEGIVAGPGHLARLSTASKTLADSKMTGMSY